MKDMADAGCQYVFMEVSSHALVQQRIAGLTFAGGIFSNITHDHLDYHKTFDEYLKAKKLFFDNLPAGSFALINADDRNGTDHGTEYKGHSALLWHPLHGRFQGPDHRKPCERNTCSIFDNQELWTRFIGEFNAYNLLAVYAAPVCSDRTSRRCCGC